ncbi:MAG: hypothetical protein QOG83_2391 [Alphaproteobacteria bacterium]|nr:hypothetical protein [Alphaproteobacteria bacterium]
MMRSLVQPSSLILFIANLAPLVGVIFWDWDAFILIMLYWLETAVIAFWAVLRIATMHRNALGDIHFEGTDKTPAPWAVAAFVTLHAGIFMAVHFMFLWELFSGGWNRKIHGVREFIDQIVVASGLWAPLLVLFVGRGVLMMYDAMRPALLRLLGIVARPDDRQPSSKLSPAETILSGLYVRIVIMQLTIILGAWFALLMGTPGAYVFLIAIKTATDISVHVFSDHIHAQWSKVKAKSSATPHT